MMDVTFRCPHCDQTVRAVLETGQGQNPHPACGHPLPEGEGMMACPECKTKWALADGALAGGDVERCLVCPSTELFVRKDFSQRLGVAIVVVGFVISSVFWYYRMPVWTYAVLFATALIDVALYLTVGNLLECYRCRAQYRGIAGLENHESFDLETHEKYRQQRIRLQQAAPK